MHVKANINPFKANVLYTGQQEQKDVFTNKEKSNRSTINKRKRF